MLPHRAAAPLEVPHQLPHFRVTGRKEFLCSPAARAPLPGAQPYRAELLVTEHQAQERHFPRKPDQSVWWWPKKPHSAHRVPPGPSRRFCLRENEASIGRARPGQHTPWASWSALLTTPTRQRVTCWGWQHGRSPGGGGREVLGGQSRALAEQPGEGPPRPACGREHVLPLQPRVLSPRQPGPKPGHRRPRPRNMKGSGSCSEEGAGQLFAPDSRKSPAKTHASGALCGALSFVPTPPSLHTHTHTPYMHTYTFTRDAHHTHTPHSCAHMHVHTLSHTHTHFFAQLHFASQS